MTLNESLAIAWKIISDSMPPYWTKRTEASGDVVPTKRAIALRDKIAAELRAAYDQGCADIRENGP